MAIGWLAALKLIPWGTVLDAAPHIVKGAKSLLATTRGDMSEPPPPPPVPTGPLSDSDRWVNLDARVRQMQQKITELDAEQQSSAELIRSLAEQNVEVVKAIEVFRVRTKVLIAMCIFLGGALAALAFWVLMK